jgi:hypothetical protein
MDSTTPESTATQASEAITPSTIPDATIVGATPSDGGLPASNTSDDDLDGNRLYGELLDRLKVGSDRLEVTVEAGRPMPKAIIYLVVRPPGKRGRRRFVCALRPDRLAALLAILTRASERLAEENRAFRQRDALERRARRDRSHRSGPRAPESALELPVPPRCAGQARRNPVEEPRAPGQAPASFLAVVQGAGKVAP